MKAMIHATADWFAKYVHQIYSTKTKYYETTESKQRLLNFFPVKMPDVRPERELRGPCVMMATI
jgi:hypothetical protein